jgi:hypothetical protein
MERNQARQSASWLNPAGQAQLQKKQTVNIRSVVNGVMYILKLGLPRAAAGLLPIIDCHMVLSSFQLRLQLFVGCLQRRNIRL